MFFFNSISDHNAMKNQLDDQTHFHGHYAHEQQQQQQQQQQADSPRSSEDIKKPTLDADEHNLEKSLVPFSCTGDGATIEMAKRRRGRPPGSKNKPKPPVVLTREAEAPPAAMRPHVLEIPAGHDVADSLARFVHRRGLGVCVLSGSGAVANVALRQPHFGSSAPQPRAATICFHGRFEILSLSATLLPPAAAALAPALSAEMAVSLAGPQGQVVGGTVAGPLVAAGTVVIMAAAFASPTFHRLPADEDVPVSVSVAGGEGDGDESSERDQSAQRQRHPQGHRQRRQHEATGASATESCGVAVYGGHLSPDVIWTPAARPPPPY